MTNNPITIKHCPNCGSSAQVKETEIETTENEITIHYECDCGTSFVTIYKAVFTFTTKKKETQKYNNFIST